MEDLSKMLSSIQKESKSLTKRHLTSELLIQIGSRKTAFGGTLEDCIRPAYENQHAWVGCVASDPDAYNVYPEFFTTLIKDYHGVENVFHPPCDFGTSSGLGFSECDPTGKYILSCRVRVGRCHSGFGFNPVLSRENRQELERKTVDALEDLRGELSGKYHPLTGITTEDREALRAGHFLFHENDSVLKSSGVYNDWPNNRGIFFNEDKTLLIWVNEEDHIRCISMQFDGNLGMVYDRLIAAVKQLELTLDFAHDKELGYLTMCPSNLGTTLRASVHIRLSNLSRQTQLLIETCTKLNLQIRGKEGAYSKWEGDVFDLSNKRRLGLTEIEAVWEMQRGVEEIIKLETTLERSRLLQ